jgi:hypothetical protein
VKASIRISALIHLIAMGLFLFAIHRVAAQTDKNVRLNEIAFRFATQLIEKGEVVPDGKGAWSKHRPSTHEENEFIRVHGFADYAKWHLGIDRRFPENSKER